jgi:DNA-binding beta-propeller fold protein YncE
MSRITLSASLAAVATFLSAPLHAQLVVSANDVKAVLIDGVTSALPTAPPDTVTLIDFRPTPPKVIAEIEVPNSVVGPPQNVAVTPNRALAFVTSSTRIDPLDAKKTGPDNRVTILDISATPPRVLATMTAGTSASGVAINPAGTLALVANRGEGTVSRYTIKGKNVSFAGKVDLGAPESGPSGIAFTPDGRMALVTRNNDHKISILAISGTNIEHKGPIDAGQKPYGIEVSAQGYVAVVGNTGLGATGGSDTVSVVDLTIDPPRVVSNTEVGPIAEGISISPDGRYVAVTVMNGSNLPKKSPQFHDYGLLKVLRLGGTTLAPVAEARIGHWCQGVAWAGLATVLAQCMVEREIEVFTFDGRTLTRRTAIRVNGGPAGIRVVQR